MTDRSGTDREFGATFADTLETDGTITDLYGRVVETGERTVVPAFHPAAALFDRSKVDDLESV